MNSKYEWIPADDKGSFPDGQKWEYFVEGVKMARIIRFFQEEEVLAGQEFGESTAISGWYSAARWVEENFK